MKNKIKKFASAAVSAAAIAKTLAKDRAHLYLGLGILSLGLLTGIFLSLAYNLNNDTLKADLLNNLEFKDQNGTQQNFGENNCKDILFKMEVFSKKDQKDSDEYKNLDAYYQTNCIGKFTKNAPDNCASLQEELNKFMDNNNTNSEEYAKVKSEFTGQCLKQKKEKPVDRCQTLKDELNKSIENNETSSDGYIKTKMEYTKLCTETKPANDKCAEIETKLQSMVDNGETSSEDYFNLKDNYLKICHTNIPVAGFEDEVITAGDQTKNPFSDTDLSTKEGLAAYELYRRGVIGGFADGTFRGDRPVNRAEAAKFLLLARLGTFTDETTGEAGFKDIKAGEWYVRFVIKASKLGIIKGYEDGTFKPASTVTTAEFTKMLSVTFDLEKGLPYSYTDVTASDWFSDFAGIVEKYNLFPDRPVGLLQPDLALTRKDVAIALYQYLLNR